MTRHPRADDKQATIAEALDRLREELRIVCQVLDEIRDELAWANRNHTDHDVFANLPRRITSFPVDPAAADFAERVNRYTAADLPAELRDPTPRPPGQLF